MSVKDMSEDLRLDAEQLERRTEAELAKRRGTAPADLLTNPSATLRRSNEVPPRPKPAA